MAEAGVFNNNALTDIAIPLDTLANTGQSLDSLAAMSQKSISSISYADYEYPFENLVFEGGGAKGQVYVGCLKVIEEVGIKPKRLAGTSAGAIVATLVAAGYNADELGEVLENDLNEIFMDHKCGICSFLPNLIRNFGWNPGNQFSKFFGELLEEKLGEGTADITFQELYKMTGIELCVCAVNVNMMSVEYFHPKPTPNMAVRLAVRMSLSIPGLFEAVRLPNHSGQTDVYIDGGLLCNYPVHAFDGWWLSMRREDSYFNRMQPLSKVQYLMEKKHRFGEYNEKTLGFMVYSSMEQDLLRSELEKRVGLDVVIRPEESQLYQSKVEAIKTKEKVLHDFENFLSSMDKFTKVLNSVNNGGDDDVDGHRSIDKRELKEALCGVMDEDVPDGVSATHIDNLNRLTKADIKVLFGPDVTLDSIFEKLDINKNSMITYDELIAFIQRSGVNIQEKFQGLNREEVHNLKDYVSGVQNCLLHNVQRLFLQAEDIERTVGINTDYIGTTDFQMADVDREFCLRQGRKSTVAFLRHHVHKNMPNKKVYIKQPVSASSSSFPDECVIPSSESEHPLLPEEQLRQRTTATK